MPASPSLADKTAKTPDGNGDTHNDVEPSAKGAPPLTEHGPNVSTAEEASEPSTSSPQIGTPPAVAIAEPALDIAVEAPTTADAGPPDPFPPTANGYTLNKLIGELPPTVC